MIPLYGTRPDDEMEHGVCPHCDTAMSIPCISIVDTLETLRSLLDGSLNTVICHGCGTRITVQEPVMVNMEAHGIEQMMFMPLSYLESGLVPFDEWAPEEIGRTFFSLDELARQVRARIIVKRLRIGV